MFTVVNSRTIFETLQEGCGHTTHAIYRCSVVKDLQQAVCEVHTKLAQKSQECIQQRRPLVRKPASRAADVKQYNPQFEEEYVAGKDYDPDR